MKNNENNRRKDFPQIVFTEEFARKGYSIRHNFLTGKECENYLSLIADYRQTHPVEEIYRQSRERSLNYKVIDGLKIKEHLPEIRRLYTDVNQIVNQTAGQILEPLKNTQVGVNINITLPGGEYRWHYDRNKITGILYLNSVEGGETECYPNYRLYLEKYRYSKPQQWLDSLLQLKIMRRLFGEQILLQPQAGSLVLMQANKCLHSVRPVLGDKERINVIMAYDAPGADFIVEQNLDSYLYNQDASISSDPNYKSGI
jgi:hypothetical protein